MVSINTNLSSLIVQNNLLKSTNALNTAIERMTTGFKINHSSDNAANYSISNNYNSKLSSLEVAAQNISMGADMVNTAQDTISEMQSRGERLLELWTQAQNGTYGADSLNAIQAECDALIAEINRLYENAEYNGITLLNGVSLPDWAKIVRSEAGKISEEEYHLYQVAGCRSFSKGGTYTISTVDDLAHLADLVNNGVDTRGVTFVLDSDLDLSSFCASNMEDGIGGWTPIGNDRYAFDGTFIGNGHKISNLLINRPKADSQGLFGSIYRDAIIKDMALENVNVTGSREVGGLVGHSDGTIEASYSSGTVTGRGQVGGLVGASRGGTIEASYSSGTVTGDVAIGGLVGESDGTIASSYSSSTVTGEEAVGGLVGGSSGTIEASYSTGTVTGVSEVGGLVGGSSGTIEASYSTGTVTGVSEVGGLVGVPKCTIASSYSTSAVNGNKTAVLIDSKGDTEELEIQEMVLQVGINGDESSHISFDMNVDVNLNIEDISQSSVFETIQSFLSQLSNKATELGAITNRLESALESTMTSMENLTSSLSTIKDADISKVSSDYIRHQILQQASATLLATANQSPSIALQLI